MGLNVTFDDSVNSIQRAWWSEAYSRTTFPLDAPAVAINATVYCVDDPPCVGHNDYMCTVVEGTSVKFYIRTGAEDPNAAMNSGVKDELNLFFMESVIHELGHAVFYTYFGDDDSIAKVVSWFVYDVHSATATRTTPVRGTPADFDQGSHDDEITEAYAEFFKDVYMPAEWRVFTNRTNWNFDRAHFDDFFKMIESVVCVAIDDGGGGPAS